MLGDLLPCQGARSCSRRSGARNVLPTLRIPDSTGRTAPNQLDSSGLLEMRSHFHHQGVGLNRQRGSDKIARMNLIL